VLYGKFIEVEYLKITLNLNCVGCARPGDHKNVDFCDKNEVFEVQIDNKLALC
jgi:hypothetical protein